MRWQERCRAGLQNYNNNYQALYSLAHMYAQSVADIQKNYVSVRYSTAQQTVGGEIAAANMGTMFGYIAGMFDPETGRRSMEFAEAARQQALQKLDDAARSGITVSVEGWNTGLKHRAITIYLAVPSAKLGVAASWIAMTVNHGIEEIAAETGPNKVSCCSTNSRNCLRRSRQ